MPIQSRTQPLNMQWVSYTELFNVDIPIYMPAFLLIPAMTCSCLPCNYSSHMALVSLLICLIEPLAPSWLWGCLRCLIDSAMEHRVAKQYRIISNNPYTLLPDKTSFTDTQMLPQWPWLIALNPVIQP